MRRREGWKQVSDGLYRDQRGGYHIDVTVAKRRLQRSAQTTDRALAEQKLTKVRTDLWRIHHLGEKPEVVWDAALIKCLAMKEREGNKTIEECRTKMRRMHKHFTGKPMVKITNDEIEAALQSLGEVSNATWNRYRADIMSVFNFAKARNWISDVPDVVKLDEPDGRVRFLPDWDQANKLLTELPDEPRTKMRRAAAFTLHTGLREANVATFRRSRIDRERKVYFIPGDEFKSGNDFWCRLSDAALAIIDSSSEPEFIFGVDDAPVWQFSTAAWSKAKKRACIDDFRWHDLRHTWASWHAINGTPLQVLQQLGGWETFDMVLRYAHLSKAYVDTFVGNSSQPAPRVVPVTPSIIQLPQQREVIDLFGGASQSRTVDLRIKSPGDSDASD